MMRVVHRGPSVASTQKRKTWSTIKTARAENDVLIAAPRPQCDQPGGMGRDDQRIMTRRDLDRAPRQAAVL